MYQIGYAVQHAIEHAYNIATCEDTSSIDTQFNALFTKSKDMITNTNATVHSLSYSDQAGQHYRLDFNKATRLNKVYKALKCVFEDKIEEMKCNP